MTQTISKLIPLFSLGVTLFSVMGQAHADASTVVCRDYFPHHTALPKPILDPITAEPRVQLVCVQVEDAGYIESVEVHSLRGSHSRMGDLHFDLVSPQGTTVRMMDTHHCGNTQNFEVTLSDSAGANLVCPPVGGTERKPTNPLDVYFWRDRRGFVGASHHR